MAIKIEKIKKLPDEPGVYFFKNRNEILYIGKATSLRDRVRSYLTSDLKQTRGLLVADMIEKATEVEFFQTDSVLDALILEGNLIQKHQPYYNTDAKDDKSFNYVVLTDEDFPQVRLVRERGFHKNPEHSLGGKTAKYVFGPYPHGLQLKEAMKIIRRIFPYRDEKCIPAPDQIRRGRQIPKPCFNRQIGLCPGVCTGEVNKKQYARIINHLRLFFEGKKGKLIQQLEKEMNAYAKDQEFEKAADMRRTIYALQHIQDVSLIKAPHEPEEIVLNRPFRMEAYDIAHMGGKNTTGVMVVSEDHEIKKADYRMFKIRRLRQGFGGQGGNDVAALKEILERRFNHPEWPWPDVVVLDGSTAQLNAAKEIIEKIDYPIKAVAVVKDDRHRPDRIIGDQKVADEHQKEILHLNGESHRFTIKYHKKLRRKSFL